jgi:ABC-2 type transport system permease protein
VLAIGRFADNAWIAYRALFQWLDPYSYMASKIISPVQQLIVFTLLVRFASGPEGMHYAVVGNAILLVALNGLDGITGTVDGERAEGTLPFVFAAPGSRFVTLLERGAVHVLDGASSAALGLILAWLLFGVDFSHANLAALVIAVLTAALSCSALGLVLGVLSLVLRDGAFLLMNLAFLILLALTGVNLPVAALPAWLQSISTVLPLTRSLEAARAAVSGSPLAMLSQPLLLELLLGLAYLLLGYALLRLVEHRARQDGVLDLA